MYYVCERPAFYVRQEVAICALEAGALLSAWHACTPVPAEAEVSGVTFMVGCLQHPFLCSLSLGFGDNSLVHSAVNVGVRIGDGRALASQVLVSKFDTNTTAGVLGIWWLLGGWRNQTWKQQCEKLKTKKQECRGGFIAGQGGAKPVKKPLTQRDN